ncbi:MAG: hypothetical protein Q7S40_16605 [Opitutaceae bacterium]|nr:hypothetical protein [Opitutaceae bacterium]
MNPAMPSKPSDSGRILFRLTEDALFVANTGRPFSLRGLEAVVYGWTTSKADHPEFDLPPPRDFQDESDARREVDRLHNEKRRVLEIPNQRASEISQQAQTAQSYAGRALLELLQNAVDANRDTPIGYKGIGFRSILTLVARPFVMNSPATLSWPCRMKEHCKRCFEEGHGYPSSCGIA